MGAAARTGLRGLIDGELVDDLHVMVSLAG